MIARAFGFAAALSLALLAALPGRAETLGDALAEAYRHSGLLEQNRALLRAADEDVAAAVAAMRPVVSYAVRSSYLDLTDTTTTNFDLSATLVLFDFGRSQLRREIARENVLSLREALIGVEQQVLLRAVSAYMNVRRTAEIVRLRENNVKLIAQELQAVRDRFEVGEVTRTDVSIAEARLAGSKSALAVARGNLTRAREEYRAAIGRYPGKLSSPPRAPATADSLEAARAVARKRHPDMLQAQRAVKIAELNIAMAEAARKPVLSGSALFSLDQDRNDTRSVGITLSGPIYQGGALASAIRKAAAQRDAARAGLHLARLAVDQNVGNAWAQLTVADAAVSASKEQIRAAKVALRGVREEARLGSRTTLDVLNAEQELLDAEAGMVSASSDRYVAVYNLLAAMGLLTAEHLKLGVPVYDPQAYYDAVKSAPLHGVSPQGQKLDRVLDALGKN